MPRVPRAKRIKPLPTEQLPAPLSPFPSGRAYLNPNLSLNASVVDAIISHLNYGSSLADAFILCGIPKPTYSSWFKKARNEELSREQGNYNTDNDIYLELYYSCQQTLAQYQQRLLNTINIASERGDWKAAAFILERVYADRFQVSSKVENISLTNGDDDSKVIEIVITDQTNPNRVADMERKIVSDMK